MSTAFKRSTAPSTICTLALLVPMMWCHSAGAEIQAAAFVQPDTVTLKVPHQALAIRRGQTVMGAGTPIRCGDELEFLSSADIKQVRVTTYQGGKNLILDALNPKAIITCKEAGLSGAMANVWAAISGGDRASYSSPATTKGSNAAATRGSDRFSLPVFSADKSLLVAGKRSLLIPWVGGDAPFKVVFKRLSTGGEVLAEVKAESGHFLRLPELDLQVGQYSMTVFHTPKDGSQPGLEEQNLFVVGSSELPVMPSILKSAKLAPQEVALLYAYYLEGYGDGRWTFEAVQRAANIKNPTEAVNNWLMTYSSK